MKEEGRWYTNNGPDEPLIMKVSGNADRTSTDQFPRTSGWSQSYLISMALSYEMLR